MKAIAGLVFVFSLLGISQSQAHDENCATQTLSVIRCQALDKTVSLTLTHKKDMQDPKTSMRCTKTLVHPFWATFELNDSTAIGDEKQIRSVIGNTSGETDENIATIATNSIHLNYDRIVNQPVGLNFDLMMTPSESHAVWSYKDGNSVRRDVALNCQRSTN